MEYLSATIITRNEERNLERCLNALKGVADEIIVVDSYSTDRTTEICKRYGCKVTSREFQGFGSQRQYATGLTTHSYVLSIDADEVIDDTLRQQIIKLKEQGFEHRVYSITVRNYFCGQPINHSGFEQTRRVRLFNKRYANWNMRSVSDSVDIPGGVEPQPLPGSIHHYRCASIEEFIKKENRIAALEAKMLTNSCRSISPVTPLFMASLQYIKAQLLHHAWLDGAHGFAIAGRRAKTTFEAYRMAIHLLKENKQLSKS